MKSSAPLCLGARFARQAQRGAERENSLSLQQWPQRAGVLDETEIAKKERANKKGQSGNAIRVWPIAINIPER
jgi:hypothetical protein